MQTFGKFIAYVSLVSLAACSTMVVGSNKTIDVSTSPAGNAATCVLTNTRDSTTITAPATTAVKRSMSDLNVTCVDAASGTMGKGTYPSDFEKDDWLNIFTLGIGMVVDWTTGAAYTYPSAINVPLDRPITSYVTAPVTPANPAPTVPAAQVISN